MRLLAVALLSVLVLTGATCQHRASEAPPASPPAMCFVPCTPSLTDTGVRWTANPNSPNAWDALADPQNGVVGQLTGRLLTCEGRRQACAGFITDAIEAGVFRAVPPKE